MKEFETLSELLEDLDREGITGYARKRLVDQFMMMRARILRKPYTASFELTPLCNFDCKMCYVHLRSNQLGQERVLSTEEWIDILQQAIDEGIMYADLTGGECLTHPGFKQIYLYLIERGVKVAILTNGQLLSEDMVAFFSKYPPSVIQITVYGSCNAAYEKITGKAAFSDVIQGIELAKRAGLNVRLVVTPNCYMQGDEERLLSVLRETGVRYDIGTASLPPRRKQGEQIIAFSWI